MSPPTLTTSMTMGQALRRIVESRPEQEALICDSLRLTYGQLLNWIETTASELAQQGVRKGDRVALFLEPGAGFIIFFFAVAELGAVVVPIASASRPAWVAQAVSRTQPALFVTQESLWSLVEQVLPAGPQTRILSPNWPEGVSPAVAGKGMPLSMPTVEASDLLAILFTSGTTGDPKGAMHTHRGLIAPVVASLRLRELWIRRPTLAQLPKMGHALLRYRERLLRAAGRPQRFLTTVPYHNTTGIEAFLQALLMGDTLVIQPRFQPAEALALIQREQITVLIAVPTALAVMLHVRDFDQYDLSSLLICGTGSAPCPPALAREIQRRFRCALHIGFGSTELGGGISATSLGDSEDVQAETVGQPMPGVEIAIADDAGRHLPPGEVGELLVRADSLMVGYWGAGDGSADVVDADGWYHTGDLATRDERGYLRIVGRKKDLIIRGGQNISPESIERHLLTHPGVGEAAVVGVPGGLGGEDIWAFVVPRSSTTLDPRQIREFCRGALDACAVPQVVRIVDSLPRSAGGKVQKFRLRDMALEERGAQ